MPEWNVGPIRASVVHTHARNTIDKQPQENAGVPKRLCNMAAMSREALKIPESDQLQLFRSPRTRLLELRSHLDV